VMDSRRGLVSITLFQNSKHPARFGMELNSALYFLQMIRTRFEN